MVETSAEDVFTRTAKVQAENLAGDLQVWALNNGVFLELGNLDERVSGTVDPSAPLTAPWREGLVRAIQRIIASVLHGKQTYFTPSYCMRVSDKLY